MMKQAITEWHPLKFLMLLWGHWQTSVGGLDGKGKSLVEKHLEFCYVTVFLSRAVPWPTCFTVEDLAAASLIHQLHSLKVGLKKKAFQIRFVSGPGHKRGEVKRKKKKKTGSYQIHMYLLETKYSDCATSWKQRCGCKHPSSSLFWSALKRENAHDALLFGGFLISLPHRNRKQQMQPIVPVLFWCFVVWCHV